MNIAIIESDSAVKSKLAKLLIDPDMSVDFFDNAIDFGHAKIHKYDVIISDLSLIPIDGRQILQSIRMKTDADLFLMGDGHFLDSDVASTHINGLINKNNPEDVIDKINYVNIKIRIKNASEKAI